MTALLQDVRYTLRHIRKKPGFAAVVIATLALGIGANTAIFGLVDSAFLHSLPFRAPERLVHVWAVEADGDQHTPTPAQYDAIREQANSFDEVAAAGWADYFLDADGVSQNLRGRVVTPNWLVTLGIKPLLGRTFRREEQIAGEDGVVMLSYNSWLSRFHRDVHVVGKQILLNRRPVTVVGVLPPSLGPYYGDMEVFAPLVLESYANQGYLRAGKLRVEIIGRLRQGVTLEQARSEADVIAVRLRHPGADRSDRLMVQDFTDELRHPGPTRANAEHGLLMTAIAAGFVLLIACTNVASLLMARAVTRRREVAVRTALGCSRARMVQQFLTETAVLFVFGGIGALIATRWCEEALTKAAAALLPGVYLQVGVRTFAVNLAISLLSAAVFGTIPAVQATQANVNENLKDGVPSVAGGTRSQQLRNGLVAGQVALGMVLLVGFGLLLRSFLHVESSPLGYDPLQVLTASVRLPLPRYANPTERVPFIQAALDRVRSMAGVESVGITDSLPMQGAESAGVRIETANAGATPVVDEIYFVSASPEYFSTLKVPVLAGRFFRETDGPNAAPVAIVNQTFAKQYFAGADPIGRQLAFADSLEKRSQIVGVVSDFRQRNPEEDLRPMAYLPIAQTASPRLSMAIRVRSASEMGNVAARLRDWLRPVDPQLYWELGSMQLQVHDSESLTLRRPVMALLACFGSVALILVVVGIFGVTAYSVAERTREMGIRIALGADRAQVALLVLHQALLIAGLGLFVGALGATAATRFLPTQGIGWSGSGIFLYQVSRTDALTYFSVAALLTTVAVIAAYVPARRAMKVDPMVALRYE